MEQNILPDAPLIVAVGRLAPEKGFDVLLLAFALIQAEIPTSRLIIIGDGPQRDRLEKMARGNSAIHFTGFRPEVIPYLQIADIVAVPSRQEGQGIAALEAMAARKPIVASRVGGLPETVIENETGLLVPPDDPPALAAALISLLRDSDGRARLGAAGRWRVEREYSAQTLAQRLAALYDSCIQ